MDEIHIHRTKKKKKRKRKLIDKIKKTQVWHKQFNVITERSGFVYITFYRFFRFFRWSRERRHRLIQLWGKKILWDMELWNSPLKDKVVHLPVLQNWQISFAELSWTTLFSIPTIHIETHCDLCWPCHAIDFIYAERKV